MSSQDRLYIKYSLVIHAVVETGRYDLVEHKNINVYINRSAAGLKALPADYRLKNMELFFFLYQK